MHVVKSRRAEWEAEVQRSRKNIGEIITFAAFFGSMIAVGIIVFAGLFEEENLVGGAMKAADFLIIAGMHVWLLFWALFFAKIFKNSSKQIGFTARSWTTEIAIGIILGGCLYFAFTGLQSLLVRFIPSPFFDFEDFLIPSGGVFAGLAVLISLTAGISEEVLYRGYANMVLYKYTKSRLVTILFLSSAFGATHIYQGTAGVIITILFALAMHGIFYLRFSLIGAISAHVIYDILATLTSNIW